MTKNDLLGLAVALSKRKPKKPEEPENGSLERKHDAYEATQRAIERPYIARIERIGYVMNPKK